MEVITIVLLSALFILGFINIHCYNHLTSKKLYAWVRSLFIRNKPNIIVVDAAKPPQESKNEGVVVVKEEVKSKKLQELKCVFATFDKNGDGFITKQELRNSLKNIRIFITEKEAEEMVVKVDQNGDGLIDFDEFCYLCESILKLGGEEKEREDGDQLGQVVAMRGGMLEKSNDGVDDGLKEAFDVFDKDKDGLISFEELGAVLCSLGLKEGKRVEYCKEMISQVDIDGDGMINFDEFKLMMSSQSKFVSVF